MDPIRRLTYSAVLTALAIVLLAYGSIHIPIGGVEGVRIGFGHFPIILAGLLYGPLAGALVGGAADIIKTLIFPTGPYTPLITIAYALTGALPPLVLMLFGRKAKAEPSFLGLSVAIVVGQTLSSILAIPAILWLQFKQPWVATFPPKLVSQVILIPCYIFLCEVILRRLHGFAVLRGKPASVEYPVAKG